MSRRRGQTLRVNMDASVHRMIADRQKQSGRPPSDREIATALGVPRSTVRDAVARMIEDGVLEPIGPRVGGKTALGRDTHQAARRVAEGAGVAMIHRFGATATRRIGTESGVDRPIANRECDRVESAELSDAVRSAMAAMTNGERAEVEAVMAGGGTLDGDLAGRLREMLANYA